MLELHFNLMQLDGTRLRMVSLPMDESFSAELQETPQKCHVDMRDPHVANLHSFASVCTWQGVTCNANEQVTMLNLNDAKLEGTIPESLGNVATLTHVYLASNSFQGPVPASVANLPNLQVIDLSFNKLNGSLPQFVSPDMMTMELGHNQFTGQLSANAADGMTSLEIFDIKYNLVTGTIPSLAASLPSLIELDLSNNQFLGRSCCCIRLL
jgi:hypothetical protein